MRTRIVALDKRRVWHPYTAMDRYVGEVEPLVVERAEGVRLYDLDGRCYLEGNASWWVSPLGHNHPRLVEALRRQSEKLCHVSLAGVTHAGAAELGEAICAAAPEGLEHVFYSDDGSTAVEVALKMAVQYWAQDGRPERCRFAALDGAFHGETLGVTAVGGVEIFRAPFRNVVADCFHLPSPGAPGADLQASIDALVRLFETEADRLAALVLEPLVQGAAGMRIYDPAYLCAARELCDRYDVFLIADEVFVGYGRTGRMWACDHAGITPDLLCTAKGFSGGMLPMAATLTTERLYRGFLGGDDRVFYYGHSFCGNPLGAAVALEVLRIFEDESILAALQPKAERIAKAFTALGVLDGVENPRSLGMIGAIDLGSGGTYLDRVGWVVYEEARKRGAYLRPLGNTVYVTPSLNIPDGDLDALLAILAESVEAALGDAGRGR